MLIYKPTVEAFTLKIRDSGFTEETSTSGKICVSHIDK